MEGQEKKKRGGEGIRTANVYAIEGLVRNSAVDGVESVLYGLGDGLLKGDGGREGGAGHGDGGGAGDLGGDPASSNCEGGHFDDVWLVVVFMCWVSWLLLLFELDPLYRDSVRDLFLVICLGEKKSWFFRCVCVTEWKGKKDLSQDGRYCCL